MIRSRLEIVAWLLENGVPDVDVDRAACLVEQDELADYMLSAPIVGPMTLTPREEAELEALDAFIDPLDPCELRLSRAAMRRLDWIWTCRLMGAEL